MRNLWPRIVQRPFVPVPARRREHDSTPLLDCCSSNTFAELCPPYACRRRVHRAAARAARPAASRFFTVPIPERMSWWSRFVGGKSEGEHRPQRVDYLTEALALERQGDYDAAITSYRLALRDQPNDHRVLQNMAIAFTKTGQVDEAVRAYRRALEAKPTLAGAHYGLAFLLLKRGDLSNAAEHLAAFLDQPPTTPEAGRWVRHAQDTLDALLAGGTGAPPDVAADVEP